MDLKDYFKRNPPLYDDVYYEAMATMNREDGESMKFTKQQRSIIQEALEKFQITMYHQLERHAERGTSWRDTDMFTLFACLYDEVEELCEVVEALENNDFSKGGCYSIMHEAADVANFAMFIFDKALKIRDELVNRDIEEGVQS